MEFKIDTKPSYTSITPLSNQLDANLAEALRQKWTELANSGSANLIIDLAGCRAADEMALDLLTAFHTDVYASDHSLVWTNVSGEVLALLKLRELDLTLNIAPTMAEAIDIISMEILERDLFGEES